MAHPRTTEVKELIEKNSVLLFMKGSPDFPMCGFSARVVEALKASGKDPGSYGTFNVLDDRDLFEALKEFAEWPTSPQLWIKGELVGGCDIIIEMHQSGELQKVLA